MKITLMKMFCNSILLEMCIPYLESAGESELLQTILNDISAHTYDHFHQYNEASETETISKVSESYLSMYREEFGSITGQNAKDLATICIGSIRRNIKDYAPLVARYYKPVNKLLTERENRFKLDKQKAMFAKGLNESLFKVAIKVSEPV